MKIKTCPSCGEDAIRELTGTVEFKVKGQTLRFLKVPHHKCGACGERLFGPESYAVMDRQRKPRIAEETRAIGSLRHLYQQMLAGDVRDTAEAACGLLGPAIEALERANTRRQAAEVQEDVMTEIDWTIEHDCIGTPDGCAALVEDEGGDMVPCKRPAEVHPPEIAPYQGAPTVSIRTEFGVLDFFGLGSDLFTVLSPHESPLCVAGKTCRVSLCFRLDQEWRLEETTSNRITDVSGSVLPKHKSKKILDVIKPIIFAWAESAGDFFLKAEIACLDRERHAVECRAQNLRKEIAELEAKARKSKEKMKELGA